MKIRLNGDEIYPAYSVVRLETGVEVDTALVEHAEQARAEFERLNEELEKAYEAAGGWDRPSTF